tara:strand:- start:47 stop:742 length:696 start_codon:yes stop_codon:yes gene_type:complete
MKIISHRGKINKIKNEENNLVCIYNFLESEISMIEIDIQLTKDNEIILYHNDYLEDTKYLLSELNSNYLIKNYNMILLKDVLDMIKGTKEIYLDIKNNNLKKYQYKFFFDELLKLLDSYILKYKCERSSIYICSFYPEYINYILSIPFNYKKGIIIDDTNLSYFNEKYNSIKDIIYFVSIDYKILESINYLFGKTIFCYTVNDISIFNELKINKSLNGIITDLPELFINEQ